MRERGVQSRSVRPGPVEPNQRPDPAPGSGTNVWQVIAIIALLVATAGWTTVAVIAIRPAAQATVATPLPSDDPNAVDPSAVDPSAPPDSHDAPALEALLPTQLSGAVLDVQSWNGDAWLALDPSLTDFLKTAGKTSTDLTVAQAYDPTGVFTGTMGIYKVTGVEPAMLRDALLAAWKGDSTDLKVSTVKIAGKDVTKGDFGPDINASFLYLRDGAVYDIETSDEAVVAAALAAIGNPGASGAPASSAAPGGSAAPAASRSPAP